MLRRLLEDGLQIAESAPPSSARALCDGVVVDAAAAPAPGPSAGGESYGITFFLSAGIHNEVATGRQSRDDAPGASDLENVSALLFARRFA